MPIKMRSTANKSTTQRMNPSWQSRNFAWSGCIEKRYMPFFTLGSSVSSSSLILDNVMLL